MQGTNEAPPITPFEQQLAALYGNAVYRRFKLDEVSGVPDDSGFFNTNGAGFYTRGVAGVGLDTTDLGIRCDGIGANLEYLDMQPPMMAYGASTGHATGALFCVAKCASSQSGAVNTLMGNGGSTAVNNRLELRFYSGGSGQLELHWRTTADGTRERRYVSASYLDDQVHFFAVVQRRDGFGPRLFVDGIEHTSFTDVASGSAPPALDFWGTELTGGGSNGYAGSSSFQASTHTLKCEIYHVSSIGTSTPVNTIVSDADILALANSIP